MPAADDQPHARKHVAPRRQPAGVDVGLQVVDRHQRHVARQASVLAAISPTSSDPASPGRLATATASRSASVTPAFASASSITGRIRSTCARDAISGTTPPNRSCSFVLRRDDRRQHLELVGDHRRRGFVARRFDGEDEHAECQWSVISVVSKHWTGLQQLTTDHRLTTEPQMMHPRRRHVGQRRSRGRTATCRAPRASACSTPASRRRSSRRHTSALAFRTPTYSKKLSVPPGAASALELREDRPHHLDRKVVQRQPRHDRVDTARSGASCSTGM